jgi:predicted TIM-barrel fold metal-dependent hydrolase
MRAERFLQFTAKEFIMNGASIRRTTRALACVPLAAAVSLVFAHNQSRQTDPSPELEEAVGWRKEHRLIDLHFHVAYENDKLDRAVEIMDRVGIGVAVNLSGGSTLGKDGKPSAFERNKSFADSRHPGRFAHYMNLDYSRWNEADFARHAVRQIEEGHRLGAAGLKEYKRLGLYLKDNKGSLIKVDDPRLDPVWQRCGELGLPVSIHVADPVAFWLPYDSNNERWTELKDHRSWWFGDSKKFPPHRRLLDALNLVIERHPKTTFVCVHFANNSEDLVWVGNALDRYPNMMVDLAARIPEIGRHDPENVRKLFIKHQDRILFGTDFMVYNKLILGSGGSGPAPTNEDAIEFFTKHWRWLETKDRQFEHMTPIQGDWKIDAIGLPGEVLRKIYFDNARKLLVRALPPPTLKARYIKRELELDGSLDEPEWQNAESVHIVSGIRSGTAHPKLSTSVRCLWSNQFLYLAYDAPFETLKTFSPPQQSGERQGLWDRDVVEAFVAPDPQHPESYLEFEVAPTGEMLDLRIEPGSKDFDWSSGFSAAVSIDQKRSLWRTEMRIPIKAISPGTAAKPGVLWRLNLYRHATNKRAFLGWSPTATGTAHTPARFGYLQLVGATPEGKTPVREGSKSQ